MDYRDEGERARLEKKGMKAAGKGHGQKADEFESTNADRQMVA